MTTTTGARVARPWRRSSAASTVPTSPAARWYGDKGGRSSGVTLDEAFVARRRRRRTSSPIAAGPLRAGRPRAIPYRSWPRPATPLRPADRATGPGGRWRPPWPRAGRSRRSRRRRRRPRPGDRRSGARRRSSAVPAAGRWPPGRRDGRRSAPLGRDQSNTSVVLGERLLLKAYRRVQPGLNPDLELTAYLSEEARVPGRPAPRRLRRGRDRATAASPPSPCSRPSSPTGRTRTRRPRSSLTAWLLAPGEVELEWATEVAADLGTLTAGLHAALATPPADAPDLAPRPATHDELTAWRVDAPRQLDRRPRGRTASATPRARAPRRARRASPPAFAASRPSRRAPLVMRIHADLHLGQVLVADDGYRVVDFEGEPLRSIEDRRRPDSPLRDVASMLRSLDHVARSAGVGRSGAQRRSDRAPGAGHDAWIERARAAVPRGVRAPGCGEAGAPIGLDLDLLDAFEVGQGGVRVRVRRDGACRPGSGRRGRGCAWLLDRRGRRDDRGGPGRRVVDDVLGRPGELAAVLHAQRPRTSRCPPSTDWSPSGSLSPDWAAHASPP